MLRFLTIAIVSCLAGACAGPGGSESASADPSIPVSLEVTRISVRDYRTGVFLALLSGSDEERIEFYSEKRDDAVTKVQDPEILAAMIQWFDDKGPGKLTVDGLAPAVGSGATKAIEVRQGERVRHVVRRPDMPPADAARFDEFVYNFQVLYNETYALQSVDSQSTDFRLEPVRSKD